MDMLHQKEEITKQKIHCFHNIETIQKLFIR